MEELHEKNYDQNDKCFYINSLFPVSYRSGNKYIKCHKSRYRDSTSQNSYDMQASSQKLRVITVAGDGSGNYNCDGPGISVANRKAMFMIKNNSAKNVIMRNLIVDGSQSDYYSKIKL